MSKDAPQEVALIALKACSQIIKALLPIHLTLIELTSKLPEPEQEQALKLIQEAIDRATKAADTINGGLE